MARPGLHAAVGISRLAALTGVTARALRHYEAVGLLHAHRGHDGRRLFEPRECETAALIIKLRQCDVSLNAIRDVLDAGSDEDRQARLRQALRDREADLSHKLDTVRSALAENTVLGRPHAA